MPDKPITIEQLRQVGVSEKTIESLDAYPSALEQDKQLTAKSIQDFARGFKAQGGDFYICIHPGWYRRLRAWWIKDDYCRKTRAIRLKAWLNRRRKPCQV